MKIKYQIDNEIRYVNVNEPLTINALADAIREKQCFEGLQSFCLDAEDDEDVECMIHFFVSQNLTPKVMAKAKNSEDNTTNAITPMPIPKVQRQQQQNKNQKLQGWRKNPEVQELVMNYIKRSENMNTQRCRGELKILVEKIEALLNVENTYNNVASFVHDLRSKQKHMPHAVENWNTADPIANMNSTAKLFLETKAKNLEICEQQLPESEPTTSQAVANCNCFAESEPTTSQAVANCNLNLAQLLVQTIFAQNSVSDGQNQNSEANFPAPSIGSPKD